MIAVTEVWFVEQWNTFEVGIWLRFCGIMFITCQIAVDQNHVGMHLTRRVISLSFSRPVKSYTHDLINLEIPSRNFSWRIKTNVPVFNWPLVSCIRDRKIYSRMGTKIAKRFEKHVPVRISSRSLAQSGKQHFRAWGMQHFWEHNFKKITKIFFTIPYTTISQWPS